MTGKRMVCQVHGCLSLLLMLSGTTLVAADGAPKSREGLKEPVLHVASSTRPNIHPFDGALELARKGLDSVHTTINDYTCTLVKRERVGGTLGDHEYMLAKVRNRRVKDGKVVVPFSVYMYFVKPTNVKGREVMYVEGANSDKMIAHEGGTAGKYLPTVWIKPGGAIAMRGNRYPITEVGIENLILKLIERGEQDKARGLSNCEVTYHKDAKVNGRTCTLLQIKHPRPAPNLDFHMAQIFIDDEMQVPIRYAAYGFPVKVGDELPVIEEYTYLNLKLNVGLTDEDFNYASKKYAFQ